MYLRIALLLPTFALPGLLDAQNRIGTGAVASLYKQHCTACHGDDLQGGLGSNLVDDIWIHGSSDEDIFRVIKQGVIEKGMVPYGDVLDDEEIQSLVIYIKEMTQIAKEADQKSNRASESGIFETQSHAFSLEEFIRMEDGIFWSVSFLPEGKMLLTQFDGDLYIAEGKSLGSPIEGIPQAIRHGQGGLLEAQAHPDYEKNGWIYLAFTEKSGSERDNSIGYMTAVVRGRVKDGKWVDEEKIFHVPAKFHKRSGVHFGTRFVFKDGYLYFSIGDRGSQNDAQDLALPNGKIHRIHDDGRIPSDNPFVDNKDAYPSIWTYGNRNPQGLDLHPTTGEIWETEHGPRGGDELNIIKRGVNYGWPEITYGINYNGRPISGKTSAPGMEQPIHYWTPSIAVCGMDFYEGSAFPQWTGDLFVTGLRSEHIERFKLDGTTILEHEVIVTDQGRVRDISTGPDGLIYVILNSTRGNGPGGVYRLVPEKN